MGQVTDLAVSAILLAGLYATMAYGLGLIYGVLRIVNLNHGGMIMAGADAGWWLHAPFGGEPSPSLVPLPPAAVVVGGGVFCFAGRGAEPGQLHAGRCAGGADLRAHLRAGNGARRARRAPRRHPVLVQPGLRRDGAAQVVRGGRARRARKRGWNRGRGADPGGRGSLRHPGAARVPHRRRRVRAAGPGARHPSRRSVRPASARMKRILPAWVRPRALIAVAVAAAILAVLPFIHGNRYWHNQLTETLLAIATALAWNWLGGYLGQVSFGHAAMFGVGGFVAARLQIAVGVPMIAAWIGAGVIAGLYALVWGHPTLRLRGPYFSIATIGVGEATRLICTYWVWLTGGSSGMSLPVQVQLKYQLYWYALALALIALAASYALRRSPLGLALLAIKSDVDAAGDVGVSSVRLQDLVLFLSGMTMGICGGFYASYYSFIEPGDMFGFARSISFVLMGVIGGIGTIAGPAIGAVIFVLLRNSLIATYPQLYLGLYGLLLIFVILFEPLGLTGLYMRVLRRARPDLGLTGMAAEESAVPATGAGPAPVEQREAK